MRNVLAASLLLASLLILGGCMMDFDPPGPVETVKQTLEIGKAEQVKAIIRFPVGRVHITGGSEKLMDGTFQFDRPAYKPVIRYDDSSFRSELSITTEKSGGSPGNTRATNWDIKLAKKVPIEIEMHAGVGEADLDFRQIDLRRLDLHMGVGKADVDLSGDPQRSYQVSVHGGVGEATIRLPTTVGVRVNASGGIGGINTRGSLKKNGNEYTNDLYGKSKITVEVEARGGVGEIKLIHEE